MGVAIVRTVGVGTGIGVGAEVGTIVLVRVGPRVGDGVGTPVGAAVRVVTGVGDNAASAFETVGLGVKEGEIVTVGGG